MAPASPAEHTPAAAVGASPGRQCPTFFPARMGLPQWASSRAFRRNRIAKRRRSCGLWNVVEARGYLFSATREFTARERFEPAGR